MRRNQQGLSLVELLISIVISSIILGAAYASYMVISNNFEFQRDMKYMAQSARAVVKMIARDVRMGGYNDFNATDISEAVKITDSAGNCCDRIDIIYDKSKTERQKISYYTKQYKNRNRLMKTVLRCTTPDCSNTSTLQSEQPIADYVEDLQFTGFRGDVEAKTGEVGYNQGNLRTITPINTSHNCTGGTQVIDNLFDLSIDTIFECTSQNSVKFIFDFDKKFRPTKMFMTGGAHIDGGSLSNNIYPYSTTYPYGTVNAVQVYAAIENKGSPSDCAWTSCSGEKNPTSQAINFTGPEAFCNLDSSYTGTGCSGSGNDEVAKRATNKIRVSAVTRHICSYTSNATPCNPIHDQQNFIRLGTLSFFGEVFGEPQTFNKVEIGLLLRSPNEHQSKNKSFSMNVGNRDYTSNDRYMRDSFSTSVIVRNLYYATH